LVLPQDTNGLDDGVDVEAAYGVQYPLAVRTATLDRFLVCGTAVGAVAARQQDPGR